MTTDEIISALRLKEKTRNPLSWKMCKETADCIERLQADKKAEEERKRHLRCPHCGGRLSEIRGNVRHCYSCNFDFEVTT